MPSNGGSIAPGRPRARWRQRLRLWRVRAAAALWPLKLPITFALALLFLVLTVIVVGWLRPVRPPRLTVITGNFAGSSPNPWSQQDADVVTSLGRVFQVTRARPGRLQHATLPVLTEQLSELPAQQRWLLWPRTTEFVYVNAAGIAVPNQAGNALVPYLLPDDFTEVLDVDRFPRGQALPVADLLQSLAQSTSDHKILVLDSQQFEPYWPLGVVSNSFVEAVRQELLQHPNRYRGVAVLLSCSPGEVAYARDGQRQSVFGNYFVLGIEGAADLEGGNQDGRVTLSELASYVQAQVAGWVRDRRGDQQQPLLLAPSINADEVVLAVARPDAVASRIQAEAALRAPASAPAADATPTIAADAQQTKQESAAAPQSPAELALAGHWQRYYRLARQDPPPYISAPQLWRRLEETLLRAELYYRANARTASESELQRVTLQFERLAAAQLNPARHQPAFSFPMLDLFNGPPEATAAASGGEPGGDAASRDGQLPTDASSEPPAGLPTSAADPSSQPSPDNPESAPPTPDTPPAPSQDPADESTDRDPSPDTGAAPDDAATDDAAPAERRRRPFSQAELLDLVNQVRDGSRSALEVGQRLNEAPPGTLALPAEAALISMMAHDWPQGEADFVTRARLLVAGRFAAEQAAVPADWAAPRVFPWVRPLVEIADRQQRQAEDAFFNSAAESSLTTPDLDQATELYTRASEVQQVIARATAWHEQFVAAAPYLTRLASARPDGSTDGFQPLVHRLTRQLLVGARDLSARLANFPESWDPPAHAAAVSDIEATHATLADSLATLQRRIADELVRLAPDGDSQPLATAADWRRAADLLLLPMACSDEPVETLSRRRLQLLRRVQLPRAAAQSTAVAAPSRDAGGQDPTRNLLRTARAARAEQLRDLALRYFALTGRPDSSDRSEPEYHVGHSRHLAAAWRRTYQTAVGDVQTADAQVTLAQRSTASRLLDPTQVAAAFPTFNNSPTQMLRRAQLADLVTWHALRRGEDFWELGQDTAVAYGTATAESYLGVAEELDPRPAAQRAPVRARLDQLATMSQSFQSPLMGELLTVVPSRLRFRGTDQQTIRLTLNMPASFPLGDVQVRLLAETADDAPPLVSVQPRRADSNPQVHEFEVSRETLRGFNSFLTMRVFFRGHVSELRLPVTAVAEEGNLNLVYQRQPPGAAELIIQRDEIVRSPNNVLFLLDLSRSMGQLPEDRIGILRANLEKFAAVAAQSGLVVGIRVFGHRYVWQPGKPATELAARTDTQLLMPLQPLGTTEFQSVVSQLQPVGESPLFHALLEARGDFDNLATGENTIVIVSDGADNWARVGQGPGLEDLRRAYRDSDIVINAIGFQTDSFGFAQLEGITNLRGGQAIRAENAGALYASLCGMSRVLKYVVQHQDLIPPQNVESGTLRFPGPEIPLAPGSYGVQVVDQNERPIADGVNVRLKADEQHKLIFRGGALVYPSLNLQQDVATSDPTNSTILRVLRADRIEDALLLQLALVNRDQPNWSPSEIQLRIRPRGASEGEVAVATNLPSNLPGHYYPVWQLRIENWPEAADTADFEVHWLEPAVGGDNVSDRPCYLLDPTTGEFTPPLPAGFHLTRLKPGALPTGELQGAAKELVTLTLVAPEGDTGLADWSFHFPRPPALVREMYHVAGGVYTGQYAFFDGQQPAAISLLGPPAGDHPANSTTARRSSLSTTVNLRLRSINALVPAPPAAD